MNLNDKRKLLILGLAALLTITNLVTFSAKAAVPAFQRCLTPLAKFEVAKKLTPKQLYQVLQMVGFKGRSLKIAWAVAMKETHGNPLAHDLNAKTGDNSWGIFQINLYGALKGRISEFGLKHAYDLTNPVTNAQIAYQLSSGGTDWSPWHANPGERDHYLVKMWLNLAPQMV